MKNYCINKNKCNAKHYQQFNQGDSTINSKIEDNKSVTNMVSKLYEEQKISNQAINNSNSLVASVKKILIKRRKYQAS